MKAATKKIVLTAKGLVSKNIINALGNTRFDGNKLYTETWVRSGRYCSLRSSRATVLSILNAQGYKYTTGNDSYRGGQEGNFIKVSKTAINFLNSLKE